MVFRAKHDKNYTVISNYYLRDRRLSSKAVGLLTKMLALPDDWEFSIRGLTAISKESFDAVRGMVIELEKAGYVVRRQRRGPFGTWKRIEYDIYEIPKLPEAEEEETEVSPPSAEVSQAEEEDAPPSRKTPLTRPNVSTLDAEALNGYRRELRENVDFETLWREYGADIDTIAAFVEMMAEVCAGTEPIRVRGQEISAKDARNRFLSLERDHILYVLESMQNTHTEIRDIRAYTLSALYNAPKTIDVYYRAKVNREED